MPQAPFDHRDLTRLPFSGRIALVVLVAVCAVAAHQATYLLGPRAVEPTGAAVHDGYWLPLVGVVLVAAGALALVTLRQLRRLSTHAGVHAHAPHPRRELRAYAWSVGALWFRIGLATAIVYAVQENLERMHVGQAASGIGALAAHGPLPLVVVLLTSLTVAAVAALVRWHCAALLACIAALTSRPPRRGMRPTYPTTSILLPGRESTGARGSRGPPRVTSAVI